MSRLKQAIAAIDAVNAGDPNQVSMDGRPQAKELVYSQRMTQWLFRIEPNPSEVLQLAARAQHIARWEVPRSTYPDGRIGYLQWRTGLYLRHADRTETILRQVGYDQETIDHVRRLLRKQGLKSDPEMQMLEDAVCLVFLQYELADFLPKHPEEKVVEILRKTWKKMSPRGHAAAQTLLSGLSDPVRQLISRALAN
ncbi:MAG TPA: DUF4202 domain-containing protein [Tepidisphaeraceae bacterium]|nr:DUF4202 domain-containing protein [Tepidisphaeraceae bacterium]